MADQQKMRAAFRELGSAKPHAKIKEENPFRFSNESVMRLLARGDRTVIDDVEELVTLIRSVRDLFRANALAADKDEVWLIATNRYEKEFGVPHRFLKVPVLRKIFNDIVVDVLSGPVYVDRRS
jgi:hypothetical protein